jgi:hypothetical protein
MRAVARLLVMMVMAREAVADPATIEVHGGIGFAAQPYETGETSSWLAGGAIALENERRAWSPRLTIDFRHIEGGENVFLDDLRIAEDPHCNAVRALAGLRVQRRDGIPLFAQLSVGLEHQRIAYEYFFRKFGASSPPEPRGPRHESYSALVFEPAIGILLREGRTKIGAQFALSVQATDTNMPLEVNAIPEQPIHLLLTVLVQTRL